MEKHKEQAVCYGAGTVLSQENSFGPPFRVVVPNFGMLLFS